MKIFKTTFFAVVLLIMALVLVGCKPEIPEPTVEPTLEPTPVGPPTEYARCMYDNGCKVFVVPNYEKPNIGKIFYLEDAPIYKDKVYANGQVTIDGITYLHLKIDGFARFDEPFGWVILHKGNPSDSNIEIFTP